MSMISQCLSCKHFKPNGMESLCAAYPQGIPDVILFNEVDHREPWPDDQGLRWEPRSPKFDYLMNEPLTQPDKNTKV